MKSKSRFFFLVAVFLMGSGIARAASPDAGSVVLPKPGETAAFEADALAFSWRAALRDVSAQVGDPDDPRFEMGCEMSPPFTVRVLGGYDATVVLRFETTTKKDRESFACKNGGVVTVSLNAWTVLKKAEAEVAAEKAAKERRREKVRGIVNGPAPAGR